MKRRAFRLICSAVLLAALALNGLTAGAAGSVTYDGSAQSFIFAPGSAYSPTDLFSDFKGVMPGDSLTQQIIIDNDVEKDVKIKLYIPPTKRRSLPTGCIWARFTRAAKSRWT